MLARQMIYPWSVCLSVRPSQTGGTAERIELVLGKQAYRLILHYIQRKFRRNSKIGTFPSGTLSQTLDLEKTCHGTSTAKRVVNLVPPTTVASLSLTFVDNIMCVTQVVARVLLRLVRLLPGCVMCVLNCVY